MSFPTRFGVLCLTEDGGAISRVTWGHCANQVETDLLLRARRQLLAYAAGKLQTFDLPLIVKGDALLKRVCTEIAAIPFGETRTYGEIAQAVGVPAKAVGQACGRNPIPVIIPCHRVMGGGGRLTGYSGGAGVETKVALLRHERAGGFLI